MGSGASGAAVETPGADLRLPVSGLRFTVSQLRVLNSYVDALYREDQKGYVDNEVETMVENLVQRIVDGAGQRDPHFRCCHVIALHKGKKMRSRSLEYLVTLDSLPVLNGSNEECRLLAGPEGYGKIRLTGREADKWEEFLTPSGYFCRDKVVERWVELIARCAHAKGGGASRMVCARAAPRAVPYQYCYLERTCQTQGGTDRRLAIVEGAAWVMLRVGSSEAEAKLVLGARVAGCSPAAYTCRVPLTHPLALLHYTSAQGGYYATSAGAGATGAGGEREAGWQLWHPTLEARLDGHISQRGTVARVAGALNTLVDKMREGNFQGGSLRLLSRYAVWCALRRHLDRCALYARAHARGFVSAHASHHLLLVLDSLLAVCSRGGGGIAGYVYRVGRASVVRRGDGGRCVDADAADWGADAAALNSCLLHLHRTVGEEIPPTMSEALETVMFSRWEALNREEARAGSTSRLRYTRRQLLYLARVATELVRCKNSAMIENGSSFDANLTHGTASNQEGTEQLVHMMAIMLDQARDLYLNNFPTRATGEFDRELSIYRSKKWIKLKDYYDASSACLIDAVRRDPELWKEDLKDEVIMMKNILNWLHKGAKEDKKYLAPVLKPYLDGLFSSSLENSWFLEDFDAKKSEEEFEGLKNYCMGVHFGRVDPCMGLLDGAKRLAWAKALVDFVDRFRHFEFRLVFPTGDGMAISFPVKLPSRREHSSARALTLSRRDKAEAKLRLATRCVMAAFSDVLVGDIRRKTSEARSRRGSSDEILANVKTGNYWRNNSKPDIIPSTSVQDLATVGTLPKVRRRSRRNRPVTAYGFPEICITSQSDTKTIRRKYHTLKNLVYTEPVESIKEMRQRPRSAGSTLRNKEVLSRPSILETLDFINSVKDALCVEESGASDVEDSQWSLDDEWLVGQTSPLNFLASRCGGNTLHLALGDIIMGLIHRAKFTILQELCSWLGDSSEGALFALHRLARAARSRSSERPAPSHWWKEPEGEEAEGLSVQSYRARPPDYISGDEAATSPSVTRAPQPPPLPRRMEQATKRYADYLPPSRLQQLERNLAQLELNNSKLNSCQALAVPAHNYTGVINPIYDVRIPKDRFSVKRSKSLGRSTSTGTKRAGLEVTRYNITLGQRSGGRTNDVVTAITGITGETGLDFKNNFFQKYTDAGVVGDSYRVSRVTVD